MDIHQTKRFWESLSPRLVIAASDYLTSNDALDTEEQTDQNQGSDKQREHPVPQVSYSSSDQRISS